MRTSTEIAELAKTKGMQSTKIVICNINHFEIDKDEAIRVKWKDGDKLFLTELIPYDHSGYEISLFSNSDFNYKRTLVIEYSGNIGEWEINTSEIIKSSKDK